MLKKYGLQCKSNDISQEMVKKAKENYPSCDFKVADVSKNINFQPIYTHVLCLHFKLHDENKDSFSIIYSWLMLEVSYFVF